MTTEKTMTVRNSNQAAACATFPQGVRATVYAFGRGGLVPVRVVLVDRVGGRDAPRVHTSDGVQWYHAQRSDTWCPWGKGSRYEVLRVHRSGDEKRAEKTRRQSAIEGVMTMRDAEVSS